MQIFPIKDTVGYITKVADCIKTELSMQAGTWEFVMHARVDPLPGCVVGHSYMQTRYFLNVAWSLAPAIMFG